MELVEHILLESFFWSVIYGKCLNYEIFLPYYIYKKLENTQDQTALQINKCVWWPINLNISQQNHLRFSNSGILGDLPFIEIGYKIFKPSQIILWHLQTTQKNGIPDLNIYITMWNRNTYLSVKISASIENIGTQKWMVGHQYLQNLIKTCVPRSVSCIWPKGDDEVYILSTSDLCIIEHLPLGSHNIMHESWKVWYQCWMM